MDDELALCVTHHFVLPMYIRAIGSGAAINVLLQSPPNLPTVKEDVDAAEA